MKRRRPSPLESAMRVCVPGATLWCLALASSGASAQDASLPVSVDATVDAPPGSAAAPARREAEVRVGGRVMAGWQYAWARGEALPGMPDDGGQSFFLQQARIKLKGKLNRYVRFKLSGDLDAAEVRDAFGELRANKQLRLRVGRFKRPFSRIELTSIGALPFRSRGLFNGDLIEDAHFGDRALGAMLFGKRSGLGWQVAVMHPDVPDSGVSGADLIGRVEYAALDWLRLGLGGGHKWTQRIGVGVADIRLASLGADLRVDLGQWDVVLEYDMAQNPAPPRAATEANVGTPWARTLLGYVSRDVSLRPWLVLQPVLAGEVYDPDADAADDTALRGVLGCNLIYDRDSRLLLQYERFAGLSATLDRRSLPRNRVYLLTSVNF